MALPLAVLLLAAGPRTRAERLVAGVVTALALAALLRPSGSVLHAATSAYAVLMTTAFVLLARFWPGRFLPRAVCAATVATAATAALGAVVWGGDFAGALRWEAARVAREAGRVLLVRPELADTIDRVVRVIAATVPAAVALQTLAGLGLAWAAHHRMTERPLGKPLGRFRDFRFGDAWIWSLVAALVVFVVPRLAALQEAALNLGIIAAVLYFVRGAAIVAAFAQAAGISTVALIAGAAVAAVVALPMFLIVPGLCTLGITDTWVQFRRRLAARSNPQ